MDPNSLALLMGSAGAAAGGSAATYVEDVFQTWLYTGNGSTQTITNGIDLASKGGLVWLKERSVGTNGHLLFDTARVSGSNEAFLQSDTTGAEISGNYLTYNSNGFSLLTASPGINVNSVTYASWTFRKQAKFFDVVTYTGNGTSGRTVSHNLGSVPGCVIIKRTDQDNPWHVWHRGVTSAMQPDWWYNYLLLNTTNAASEWTNGLLSQPTSSSIELGGGGNVNASGGTYVAYLFAHDAGGFGASGNDSVVKCGSYTGESLVDLGWEPQWVLTKKITNNNGVLRDWMITDTMRGLRTSGQNANGLFPNTNGTETTNNEGVYINSTGFTTAFDRAGSPGETYIYIAIRRGPMKTPTDATKVFGLSARNGTNANATVSGGQVADGVIIKNRTSGFAGNLFAARLVGTGYVFSDSTGAEQAADFSILQSNPWDVMDGVKVGTTSDFTNASGYAFINYLFRRAPGFFDVVAYTGTGVARTVSHNLGVAPELMIVKSRSNAYGWGAYHSALGKDAYIPLTSSTPNTSSTAWNSTSPTSTTFSTGNGLVVNGSALTYIAYLFASCPGVSKVGSYTGTGTTLSIDCGFTNGARFVLIKRTDSTGAWYVWDTARGIIANNDPYLLLNSTAAEVTNTDYIDPLSSGFQISSTAPAAINANGGTFIYLAVA